MLFLLILITITIIIIISLIITIMVIISDPPSLGWTLTVGGHSSVSNEDKSKQNQKPRPSYWWGWWQRQSTEKSRDRSGTLDFVTSGSNYLYVLFFLLKRLENTTYQNCISLPSLLCYTGNLFWRGHIINTSHCNGFLNYFYDPPST